MYYIGSSIMVCEAYCNSAGATDVLMASAPTAIWCLKLHVVLRSSLGPVTGIIIESI